MPDNDIPEPFEQWSGPSWEQMLAGLGKKGNPMVTWEKSEAGKSYRERSGMELRNEADHADRWLSATQHLHDPGLITKAMKVISDGKRNRLMPGDVNSEMSRMFPGIYPEFNPRDVVNNIPDSLGDQFR